jgi:predicted AAA+ superfamily ATPase
VTGSNAKLLSSEISTSLTGRNKLIELFPFSFSEYLLFKEKKYDPDHLTSKSKALLQKDFNTYMQTGGFPLFILEKVRLFSQETNHEFQKGLYYRSRICHPVGI